MAFNLLIGIPIFEEVVMTRKYFFTAAFVYLCASLLLVSCGGKDRRTDIKKGRPQILSQEEAEQKQVFTGGNTEGFEHVYLMSSDSPDGVARYILSQLNEDEKKLSVEFSKHIPSLFVARKSGSVIVEAVYFKDLKKSEAEVLSFNVGSLDTLMSDMSRTEMVKDGDFGLSLKCIFADCHGAVAELNLNGAKLFYYVSMFSADISIVDQRVSASDSVSFEKGIKKHPLSAIFEKDKNQTFISNSINVLNGISLLWIGIEGEAPAGQPMIVQSSGNLIRIDNNAIRSVEFSSYDNRKLIKKTELLSHKKEGELQVQFTLDSEQDSDKDKKNKENNSAARYIKLNLKPKFFEKSAAK